jgi:hypothetical protein
MAFFFVLPAKYIITVQRTEFPEPPEILKL